VNKTKSIFSENNSRIPIWFLRQAGRHIPEYFEIRKKADNFINFCLNTDLIVESTKLPLKYYDLDAAIVFSDILMIPWAMNRNVNFIQGFGPSLEPMIPAETKIIKNIDIFNKLKPLQKSILKLKNELPKEKKLIGFAGAPWTLACYMIEGQGSKDFINTRRALWNSHTWFIELLETLTINVVNKLEMQAKAGADILMLFDSWSHMIPNNFFQECCITPTANIVKMLREKNISNPIIGFPFKAGSSLIKYSYESNVDCIALDWSVNLSWAKENINSLITIQGNLDPISLTPERSIHLEKNVLYILDTMKDNKFIFNVGHGLTPDCKIKNVRKVIDIVRSYK
tara:strand:- start:452 stop:1474 length:1023 start_codon:yes stop_codon:yes gene_type:complete